MRILRLTDPAKNHVEADYFAPRIGIKWTTIAPKLISQGAEKVSFNVCEGLISQRGDIIVDPVSSYEGLCYLLR